MGNILKQAASRTLSPKSPAERDIVGTIGMVGMTALYIRVTARRSEDWKEEGREDADGRKGHRMKEEGGRNLDTASVGENRILIRTRASGVSASKR